MTNMQQTGGYIKIYRKILQWEWWNDPIMLKTWMYILLTATHKEIRWMGAVIPRGCFVTTQRKLAVELGVSRRTVQKNLKRLVNSGNITTKVNHDNTIIIICNYDSYQSEYEESEPQCNPQSSPISSPQSSPHVNPQSSPQSSPYNNNIKNKKNNNTPPPTPVRVCACEEVDVNNLTEWLKNESGDIWKDNVMMQLGIIDKNTLEMAFEDFQQECIAQGIEKKDTKDIRSHFVNMMRIVKQKQQTNESRNNQKGNIQHTDTRELARIAKSMADYEKSLRNG